MENCSRKDSSCNQKSTSCAISYSGSNFKTEEGYFEPRDWNSQVLSNFSAGRIWTHTGIKNIHQPVHIISCKTTFCFSVCGFEIHRLYKKTIHFTSETWNSDHYSFWLKTFDTSVLLKSRVLDLGTRSNFQKLIDRVSTELLCLLSVFLLSKCSVLAKSSSAGKHPNTSCGTQKWMRMSKKVCGNWMSSTPPTSDGVLSSSCCSNKRFNLFQN